MILGSAAGVSALAASSSDMPFLNALMPCATSPISSEILPRPNSSRTTAITTIQCQMLSEPIENPPHRQRHVAFLPPPRFGPNLGAKGGKHKNAMAAANGLPNHG